MYRFLHWLPPLWGCQRITSSFCRSQKDGYSFLQENCWWNSSHIPDNSKIPHGYSVRNEKLLKIWILAALRFLNKKSQDKHKKFDLTFYLQAMILIFYHRRLLYCLIYRNFFTGSLLLDNAPPLCGTTYFPQNIIYWYALSNIFIFYKLHSETHTDLSLYPSLYVQLKSTKVKLRKIIYRTVLSMI